MKLLTPTLVPEQRKPQLLPTPPQISVGDTVLVTRYLRRTRQVERAGYRMYENHTVEQLLLGYVKLTPDTTPAFEVFTDRKGNETGRLPRMPLYHVAQVTLIESDGEMMYQKNPDMLLIPEWQKFKIEHFDRHPEETVVIDLANR